MKDKTKVKSMLSDAKSTQFVTEKFGNTTSLMDTGKKKSKGKPSDTLKW